MKSATRLFTAQVNLEELNRDLNKNEVENIEWFSIVESFIRSFEQEEELVHLVSISQLHVENSLETQKFSKTFFKVLTDSKLEKIANSVFISKEEYYEKLTNYRGDSVESKIKLSFDYRGFNWVVNFTKTSDVTLIQINSIDNLQIESLEELFRSFCSIRRGEELNNSIEEVFYKVRVP